MSKFRSFAGLIALSLSYTRLVAGAIGPVADMTISNADVSPDGFSRAAVLVNGVFPGPLITGNMVRTPLLINVFLRCLPHYTLGR